MSQLDVKLTQEPGLFNDQLVMEVTEEKDENKPKSIQEKVQNSINAIKLMFENAVNVTEGTGLLCTIDSEFEKTINKVLTYNKAQIDNGDEDPLDLKEPIESLSKIIDLDLWNDKKEIVELIVRINAIHMELMAFSTSFDLSTHIRFILNNTEQVDKLNINDVINKLKK